MDRQPVPSYLVSWSLGQGRTLSDGDFEAFLEGATTDWTLGRRVKVALLLLRNPWRQEVRRWKVAQRLASEFVDGKVNTSESRRIVRNSVKWGIGTISFAATCFLVIFITRNPSGPNMPEDAVTLVALNNASLDRADGSLDKWWLYVPRSKNGVELLEPKNTIVPTLTPTLRWKLDGGSTQVVQVSVFVGDDTESPVDSAPSPIAMEWTVSKPLVLGKQYTWEVTHTEGDGQVREHAKFATPAHQFSLDYAEGKLEGLTPLQEATALIDLGRYAEALGKLQAVLSVDEVSPTEKAAIGHLVQRLRKESSSEKGSQ